MFLVPLSPRASLSEGEATVKLSVFAVEEFERMTLLTLLTVAPLKVSVPTGPVAPMFNAAERPEVTSIAPIA
jgi:hypothetical protein